MTIELTQVASDYLGNTRYVCSYLCIADTFESALELAREIGGKKYQSNKISGGIVFKTRKSLDELVESIERVKGGIHEQTIREHVTCHVAGAIDQSYAYGGLVGAREAYAQNLIDSVLEDGYSDDDTFDATSGFYRMFREKTGVTV